MKNIIIRISRPFVNKNIHIFSQESQRFAARSSGSPKCENCRYYMERDGFRICKLVGFTPEIARSNENLCGSNGSFFEWADMPRPPAGELP
jgi:hypothetical protein